MLLSGHLGDSNVGYSVSNEVFLRFPKTLVLLVVALLLGTVLGIVIGMLFSFRGGKGKNTFQIFATTIPLSLPDVLIILCFQLAVINLRKEGLPVPNISGYKGLSSIILPSISLSIIPMFYMARITFAAAIEAYGERFVLTSRAKGCSEKRVHWVHVWRRIRKQVIGSSYTMIPVIISNLLIVEYLFTYPGLTYSLFKSLLNLKRKTLILFHG